MISSWDEVAAGPDWVCAHSGARELLDEIWDRLRALRQHAEGRLRAGGGEQVGHRRGDVGAGGQVRAAHRLGRQRRVQVHRAPLLDLRLHLRLPLVGHAEARRGDAFDDRLRVRALFKQAAVLPVVGDAVPTVGVEAESISPRCQVV